MHTFLHTSFWFFSPVLVHGICIPVVNRRLLVENLPLIVDLIPVGQGKGKLFAHIFVGSGNFSLQYALLLSCWFLFVTVVWLDGRYEKCVPFFCFSPVLFLNPAFYPVAWCGLPYSLLPGFVVVFFCCMGGCDLAVCPLAGSCRPCVNTRGLGCMVQGQYLGEVQKDLLTSYVLAPLIQLLHNVLLCLLSCPPRWKCAIWCFTSTVALGLFCHGCWASH